MSISHKDDLAPKLVTISWHQLSSLALISVFRIDRRYRREGELDAGQQHPSLSRFPKQKTWISGRPGVLELSDLCTVTGISGWSFGLLPYVQRTAALPQRAPSALLQDGTKRGYSTMLTTVYLQYTA